MRDQQDLQPSALLQKGEADLPELEAPHGTARVIGGNVLANLFRQGSAWLLILIVPPLMVRSMSRQSYATWVLILQVSGYVTLIDTAIQGAVGRFVAHAKSLNERRIMSEMVSSALLLLLVCSVLAALLLIGFAWQMPVLMRHRATGIDAAAPKALLIVGLAYAFSLPFAAPAGVFVGMQKNGVLAVASTTGKIISAAGMLWAALHRMGLVWIAGLTSIGVLVQPLICLFALTRLPHRPEFSVSMLSRESIKLFFSFSSALLLTQLTALLITGLDLPIVTAFDFPHAAYYAIAITLSNMVLAPFSSILSPLMPVAAAKSATSTPRHLGDMLLRTTRFATCILCLITLFLALGMHPLLSWWLTRDYADHAWVYAEVLVAAQFIRLTLMPYWLVSFSAGQQKQMLASPIGEAIVNLLVSLAGAALFGAVGVAAGTMVGAAVGVGLHFLVSMRRTTGVVFSRSALLRDIGRPVLVTVIPVGIFIGLARRLHGNGAVFALATGCEVLAAVLLFYGALDRADRSDIQGHLLSLRKPNRGQVEHA